MNLDPKKESNTQELILRDQKNMEITGVKKIENLNSEEFLVNTILGNIAICGEDLEIQNLDIDKGHLWISGKIFSIEYLESVKTNNKKSSFVSKLFK